MNWEAKWDSIRWTVIRKVFVGSRVPMDDIVAIVSSDDESEANARLIAAAPELLAACEMVIKAAIGNNPPHYLDEFIAEGMGRLNVCLTPAELMQLKQALAPARADSGEEVRQDDG